MTDAILSDEIIVNKIYSIRGYKIMFDVSLAELYKVETRQLKRQVRRNPERFPDDFMFELTPEEYEISRCQFGALKQGENLRYAPMEFNEQGVAMLSSVLIAPGLLTSTFRSCLMCSMQFSLKKTATFFFNWLGLLSISLYFISANYRAF